MSNLDKNAAYIVAATRTPIGSFMGALKDQAAPKMAAECIKTLLKQAQLDPQLVDQCIMGNVLTAGVGQAPARQSAIFGGLPIKTECLTINKVCGSGLKSVMLAADAIRTGQADVIIAGGQENMSLAPHLLKNSRNGFRYGNFEAVDSMIHDGLWEVYHQYAMGNAAELCAREKNITRQEQDDFAKISYARANESIAQKKFEAEITPVAIVEKKETRFVTTDEEPGRGKPEKFASLPSAFIPGGSVTAANASSINDGAATLLIVSGRKCQELGLKPMAQIVSYNGFAQAPEWFTIAPIGAIQKLLKNNNMTQKQIDLWEINEAFSVVSLACMRGLELTNNNVNIRGGAVALGHPIGASGARILTTLVHTLQQENKKRGVASLCIGGGEAVALMIESM